MKIQYKSLRTFTVFHAYGYATVTAYSLKGAAMRFFRVTGRQAESVLPGRLSF